jgi:phage virion morphogenesis protein
MAVTLRLSLDDVVARNYLEDLDQAAADLTPLMDNIGALVEQSTKDRISETNVSPEGAPWPKSLRAQEDGGKTLFASGILAASITHNAGRQSVEIGSNLIYAGVHQTGATIVPKSADVLTFQLPGGQFVQVGSVTIPARPYLGLSADDIDDITDLTERHFGVPQ